MTPGQKELARHALGLPNRRDTSYRKHFCAGDGHPDFANWQAMVAAGEATRRDAKTLPYGGDHLFHLTLAGAKLALDGKETLCPEDFPEAT